MKIPMVLFKFQKFKFFRFHRNKIWIQPFKEPKRDSFEDGSFFGYDSLDDDLPILSIEDYDYSYVDGRSWDGPWAINYGNYGNYKRKRRVAREIFAEAPEEEPPTRKDTNHKKKSKPIDSADLDFRGVFPDVGPSGIHDLHGHFIINITWPFLQDEKPNECSHDNYESLYNEGDERCVCDQMLQDDINPAVQTTACFAKRDQDRDTDNCDNCVGSVCGSDKFDEPICFLNGCGNIISG